MDQKLPANAGKATKSGPNREANREDFKKPNSKDCYDRLHREDFKKPSSEDFYDRLERMDDSSDEGSGSSYASSARVGAIAVPGPAAAHSGQANYSETSVTSTSFDDEEAPAIYEEEEPANQVPLDATLVSTKKRNKRKDINSVKQEELLEATVLGRDIDSAKERKICLVIVVIVVLAVIGGIIGVVLGTSGNSGENVALEQSTQAPTAYEGPTPYEQSDVIAIIEGLQGDDDEWDLGENSTSPEAEALRWLLDDDGSGILEDGNTPAWRIEQRFLLAAFYFATGGTTSWLNSLGFLSSDHECDWKATIPYQDRQEPGTLDFLRRSIGSQVGIVLCPGCDERVVQLPTPQKREVFAGVTECSRADQRIEVLRIPHNKLTGSLPGFLSNLTSLRTLSLEGNDFTGTLPEFHGLAMTTLEVLELSDTFPCNLLYIP